MECKFASVSRICLIDDDGKPMPRERYEIVGSDCQSITIKIRDNVTFSDDELKLLFDLTVETIDDGGTPMRMIKYLDLYNKLEKLIERKQDK